jgi:NAD-dependent dihydropyrimidine dehydrogenase PreA subunit
MAGTSQGMFIDVKVDPKVAADPALVKKLVEVCPVNIFKQAASGALEIVGANLDECTLCDLCIKAAPDGTVQVVKLYE